YGYLRGAHCRDKDAVVASMLICEMAAYYKAKGMSLYDFMQSIYKKYGLYLNTLLNFNFEGAAGMQKMVDMMNALRENPPKEIGGEAVESITDYKASVCKDLTTGGETAVALPKSNVLQYRLAGEDSVIVRPSGTEPKIKIYITSVADTRENAQAKADTIAKDMEKRLGI
ncbi:MAG: phospho-sugar mutase, partial [Ruminococcus sp.]|nr:phospho-sugar mutase [Ruminococcus sp.]